MMFSFSSYTYYLFLNEMNLSISILCLFFFFKMFKNFFLSVEIDIYNEVKWSESSQLCLTLCDPRDYTVHGILQARILEWVPFPSPGDLPNQNIGEGSLSLLQGIFPTQGLNQGLPHCRQILYRRSHKASPRILEWVSLSLLQWIFPTQELNRVSCIAGRFSTNWAIREAHHL